MKNIRGELLLLAGSLMLFCGCGTSKEITFTESAAAEVTYEKETVQETDSRILVYVCGAVNEPGVVETDSGARIVDAIVLAGGMTEEADGNFMNLAERISDGEKIYVPTKEEVLQWELQEEKRQQININTADAKELCELSGIGESRAGDIIRYREKHGRFETKEDIMKVPGIKTSLYEKIADQIVTE